MAPAGSQIVRGMYEAFAKGDIPSVLSAMDPQIEWNEAENFPYADRNPYVGPSEVVEGVFQRLANEWDNWTLSTPELIDGGDTVVALGRYQATNKATAKPINAQFAHVWRLRNGKVIGFQQYTDTKAVAAAMAT